MLDRGACKTSLEPKFSRCEATWTTETPGTLEPMGESPNRDKNAPDLPLIHHPVESLHQRDVRKLCFSEYNTLTYQELYCTVQVYHLSWLLVA